MTPKASNKGGKKDKLDFLKITKFLDIKITKL